MSEAVNDRVIRHELMQPFIQTTTSWVSFAAYFITVSGKGEYTIILSLLEALRASLVKGMSLWLPLVFRVLHGCGLRSIWGIDSPSLMSSFKDWSVFLSMYIYGWQGGGLCRPALWNILRNICAHWQWLTFSLSVFALVHSEYRGCAYWQLSISSKF